MTYTDNDNILRSYGYTYDEMNRLKGSYYQKEYTETNSYDEHLTYDKNGNILTLNRNGFIDGDTPGMTYPIDELNYMYENNNKSNRLVSVADHTNSIDGFKDGNLSGVDYDYDDFGNMIRDRNKGIDKIIYNHLNLPIKIVFSNSSEIHYIYNAVGVKMRKRVVSATSGYELDGDTHYIAGFQYRNDELQLFPTAEGYVNVTDGGKFNYVYNYTDHLGNVRLSYAYNDRTSELSILEENHYYPFGLKHSNYNVDKLEIKEDDNGGEFVVLEPVDRNKYQYKYNGKEFQDELSLNWYDYQARNYEPALGRWMNIDPLAETSRRFSSYAYCLNNPIYFIDPDGMQADDWINWTGKNGQQHITYHQGITTVEQAKSAGYTTATQVVAAGSGSIKKTGEKFSFQAGGKFSVNGGPVMDVADSGYQTEGGAYINKGLTGVEQAATALQGTGDGITAIGIMTGNPILIGAGETIGGIGFGLEVANNFAVDGVTKETLIENGVKIGIDVGFGVLGNAGIKATQTVAGKEYFESGANVVSETIIQGVTTVGSKVAEKVSDEILKR